MANPIQFKSGEFYGDVHQGERASVFDIRRLSANRSEDEVETHRHDNAHFVLVLSGLYISSAIHAPARAPSPTLVFNRAGTTRRDRFVDGKGSFLTVSLDPALLKGAAELHTAQEGAAMLSDPASVAGALRIAREIGRGGDAALLEAGAWELLAGLRRGAAKTRRAQPAWTLARTRERPERAGLRRRQPAVVVITTTNFQVRDAHPLSEQLLTSLIMPVLMRP